VAWSTIETNVRFTRIPFQKTGKTGLIYWGYPEVGQDREKKKPAIENANERPAGLRCKKKSPQRGNKQMAIIPRETGNSQERK